MVLCAGRKEEKWQERARAREKATERASERARERERVRAAASHVRRRDAVVLSHSVAPRHVQAARPRRRAPPARSTRAGRRGDTAAFSRQELGPVRRGGEQGAGSSRARTWKGGGGTTAGPSRGRTGAACEACWRSPAPKRGQERRVRVGDIRQLYATAALSLSSFFLHTQHTTHHPQVHHERHRRHTARKCGSETGEDGSAGKTRLLGWAKLGSLCEGEVERSKGTERGRD
eukprot:13144-Rhodomonas_salina.4